MNIRLLQGNSQRMRTRHMWFWMRNIQLFWFFKIPNSCGTNNLTIPLYVASRLFSNRSQMTSKCGKNKKVAQEAQLSVLLIFLPHLTSSVIYCRTDQPQRGIYLFFYDKKAKSFKVMTSYTRLSSSKSLIRTNQNACRIQLIIEI